MYFEDYLWCLNHNARVRFHSNQTVEVLVNGNRRRRATLHEAVAAHGVPIARFAFRKNPSHG